MGTEKAWADHEPYLYVFVDRPESQMSSHTDYTWTVCVADVHFVPKWNVEFSMLSGVLLNLECEGKCYKILFCRNGLTCLFLFGAVEKLALQCWQMNEDEDGWDLFRCALSSRCDMKVLMQAGKVHLITCARDEGDSSIFISSSCFSLLRRSSTLMRLNWESFDDDPASWTFLDIFRRKRWKILTPLLGEINQRSQSEIGICIGPCHLHKIFMVLLKSVQISTISLPQRRLVTILLSLSTPYVLFLQGPGGTPHWLCIKASVTRCMNRHGDDAKEAISGKDYCLC